jgi:hypothetical protein
VVIEHLLVLDHLHLSDTGEKAGVQYNILLEFGVPMKLVMLIKMCLNEIYIKVLMGKRLSDSVPFQNGYIMIFPSLCYQQ